MDFYKSPEFATVEFEPRAKDGLLELKKENDLFIISKKHVTTEQVMLDYFENNLPGVFTDIKIIGRWGVGSWDNQEYKWEVTKRLKLNSFVDDHPRYCVEMMRNGVHPVLYLKPQSLTEVLADRIDSRVKSWQEIAWRLASQKSPKRLIYSL
jgi:hypothetical protein